MNPKSDFEFQSMSSGKVNISEDVIATIASVAAGQVDGVTVLNPTGNWADLLNKKQKGVKITIVDNAADIEINVSILYGKIIMETSQAVQNAVSSAIESMTGLHVNAVNVRVNNVTFPEPTKA